MSVKFRPIVQEDKKRMTLSHESAITRSPMSNIKSMESQTGTVVSDSIFGKLSHSDDPDCDLKDFEDKYTRVGYIDLVAPVLNPFLAGRSASVWKSVLNLSKDDVLKIINGELIFDTDRQVPVLVSSCGTKPFSSTRYLYGANYLLYLLDKVNIKSGLEYALIKTFIFPHMTRDQIRRFKAGEFYVGEILQFGPEDLNDALGGNLKGWFYGNYYIDLDGSDFLENAKNLTEEEFIKNDIYNRLYEAVIDSQVTELKQFPIISLFAMLAEEGGKDKLRSQILDYVFVLPYGLRPTIDKRIDPLTSQYNKLTYVNNELRDILGQVSPTVYMVMNKYRELVALIRNIFIGDEDVIRSQYLKDYKSLSDTITGKEGLMRGRMQGARVDNSGRAVITCDPDMPIDTIGVPRKLLYKIAEPAVIRDLRNYKDPTDGSSRFKNKNLSRFSTSYGESTESLTYKDYVEQWFKAEDRYGIPGRQPTLFYLGMQAFKIRPIDGDSIVLSPLIVMPFNADFDGDQMHYNMPITSEANREVKERMSFTNNLRYPKNGEITVVTRHEIIYGLWICNTKISGQEEIQQYNVINVNEIAEELGMQTNAGLSRIVYEAVCTQRMNVYDKVSINARHDTAGNIALEYAIYGSIQKKSLREKLTEFNKKEITDKTITKLLVEACGDRNESFLHAVNRIVRLGFRVARIWPPNISTIIPSEVENHIKTLTREFNERISQHEELVNIGLEIDEEFSSYFNSEWEVLQKTVTNYLMDNLGIDNGYIAMVKSGAKGSKSNIQQIFGIKGRVQKNDISTFNSIITGSYAGYLTGLEHAVTAYGSRKGIADKVLATAEPGYLSRKLEHAGSLVAIMHENCGTKNGMRFTISDIVPFIDPSQISRFGTKPGRFVDEAVFYSRPETETQLLACSSYLAKIIEGRYCVDSDGNSIFIKTRSDAIHFINKYWGYYERYTHKWIPPVGNGEVIMRSPVYCEKPVCACCYGRDIAAGTNAPKIGRPIGFIAAQAIGEPGTQMTMKNFQRGGVVSDANLTSSFELIEDYFELHDFSKKKRSKRGVYSYDIISPVSGFVKEQYLGNGSKRIFVTKHAEDNIGASLIPGTKRLLVHEDTKLKKYVEVGDSFQEIQGNLNMKEVLRYRGYDKAASYLCLALFSIFETQDINFKHFECIVAGMTCAQLITDVEENNTSNKILYGKGSEFKAGSILTRQEVYWSAMNGKIKVQPIWTLIGLKTLPKFKADFIESLLMESMDSYIPRAILMNPSDSMSNPITRTAFGLDIGIGASLER